MSERIRRILDMGNTSPRGRTRAKAPSTSDENAASSKKPSPHQFIPQHFQFHLEPKLKLKDRTVRI